ncbi:hypothetical protein BBP00_00004982 [Phytophthora kernoviae]|uniref:Uncharacterized protein n=1 Tax=Phytophthora kernoviae TaxID=325452 RepID=A0A3F2RQZ9_9STRA|nr:hypothetical protein BBP00_00004982 [Phytophthora kernoviae]
MADLLVNVPQMQRDLQLAREDNAYLRTLLEQLNAGDVTSSPSVPRHAAKKAATRSKDANDSDKDFDRALARREARLEAASSTNGTLATGLELKSANDRIALLERQLLDAEETICHLKAEKLAALRDVEKLSAAPEQRGGVGRKEDKQEKKTRKLVLELETRLAEQQQAHALEQEQRLAVIRDQEKEVTTLRQDLDERSKQLEELQQRHLDLLELDGKAVKKRVTSGVNQLSIIGEESDDDRDDDEEDEKPQLKKIGSRKRAPALSGLPKWQGELVVTTKGPLPDDFPMGVELPRLPPEVRDGFLTLVLPLLRKQTQREIQAHSRRYNDGFHTDLRFRVVPRE